MEFDRLLSAAADYGFPMLVSSYLLVRMEGRIEKLSANIDTLTRVLQERLVMQFPYAQGLSYTKYGSFFFIKILKPPPNIVWERFFLW